MGTAYLKPILSASLPSQFRQIHLELARECGRPEGDTDVAYTIIAPLDENGRIDPMLWRAFRHACRVARLRPGEDNFLGHLDYHLSGGWAFHYDWNPSLPDEIGSHFANERFVEGEYVSINESGKMHTYRVVSVSHL
jgi:hypothetical protein